MSGPPFVVRAAPVRGTCWPSTRPPPLDRDAVVGGSGAVLRKSDVAPNGPVVHCERTYRILVSFPPSRRRGVSTDVEHSRLHARLLRPGRPARGPTQAGIGGGLAGGPVAPLARGDRPGV